ncbi:2-hydroxyacid dehydrogenase [Thermogymnomonas acidicola]|uniref:2-hydroxyacid dehydrogenase n=1 Tax=Thermogymnomonas acidicola TaxID=399579 RepID=A0AA37F8X1_9ARCH|nr:2-hydroxyacid dehydrogenase [Thermogymnomonas acidicola]GGM69058.1 2-hydroxyacid dehydrogenase [Thermogymnomonas acidicola]
MKVSLNIRVDRNTFEECRRIVGDGLVMGPDPEAEVQIFGREFVLGRNTKMLQCVYAGVNHIDFTRIPENVLVCSNAGAYSESVAEQVFALIFHITRKVCYFNSRTHAGEFRQEPVGFLYGKTISVIGYGGIGAQVARVAKALGMKVIGYSRRKIEDKNCDLQVDSIEDAARQSDIMVICLPLTKETRGCIGGAVLGAFRGTIIVNIARADVVDRDSMLSFLERNREKYYLSDVWWNEPRIEVPIPDNAVLTPHVAGGPNPSAGGDDTVSDVFRLAILRACENVRDFMQGNAPRNVVRREDYV